MSKTGMEIEPKYAARIERILKVARDYDRSTKWAMDLAVYSMSYDGGPDGKKAERMVAEYMKQRDKSSDSLIGGNQIQA